MHTLSDLRGYPVTGAGPSALELFERALADFQRYVGDPLGTVNRVLEQSPRFVLAYCLKAYLCLTGMEASAVGEAAASLQAASRLPGTERERLHLTAISQLVAGDYERAVASLDAVLTESPLDVLALQAAHLFDFYRGDSRNLRDCVARVLHAWSSSVPGYHAVLGMYAFGLEECANYGKAEDVGRRALELEARDTWAHHAVAHVMEMQGRREDGLQWMGTRRDAWATDSFFSIHNYWHWALFLLDLERPHDVLDLYDGALRKGSSKTVLDLVDASALLWRLRLRDIDVGERWQELAEAWASLAGDGFYAFNDAHAVMAFIGANRWELVAEVLAAQQARLERGGSNQAMTREVGLPLCRALSAFGRGDYAAAIELLQPLLGVAHRFGGSHAQRDLLDLTLLEAASRAGRWSLLRALAGARSEARPPAALTLRYRAKAELGLRIPGTLPAT